MTEQEAEARRLVGIHRTHGDAVPTKAQRDACDVCYLLDALAKAEQERDEKATEAYENGYALGLAQGWEKGQARERELRKAIEEFVAPWPDPKHYPQLKRALQATQEDE